MTIAMRAPLGPSSAEPADDSVAWRALRDGVWAARRDGRHLGTVERGRRWIATDADSELIGAYRTFREAQAAVAEPGAHRGQRRRTASPQLATALVVAAAAAAPVAGWICAGLLL